MPSYLSRSCNVFLGRDLQLQVVKTMPALAQRAAISPDQFGLGLRVWTPDDDCEAVPVVTPGEHRIPNPVLRKTRKKSDAPGQGKLWDSSPLDPAVVARAEKSLEQFRDVVFSRGQIAWMRANLTLRKFYVDHMEPARRAAVLDGQMSSETISKDFQVINRWEEFTRPDDWPADAEWPGQPIGFTAAQYVKHFLSRLKAANYADGTILTTKCHLVTMLNRAARMGIIDVFEVETPKVARTEARHYSEKEASDAYLRLATRPLLRTAFVLSLATGARPIDLFSLKWSNARIDAKPLLRFVSKKTGMHMSVPLGEVASRHLYDLFMNPDRKESPYLFPGLGSPDAKFPERSKPSRHRNAVMKSMLFAAGVLDIDNGDQVEIEKPWQVGRSTAATWIERVARGMSSVLLGHDDDDGPKRVTSVHYLPSEMEPSKELVDAVNAVEWPEVFQK